MARRVTCAARGGGGRGRAAGRHERAGSAQLAADRAEQQSRRASSMLHAAREPPRVGADTARLRGRSTRALCDALVGGERRTVSP